MTNIKITPLNLDSDLKQIGNWATEFADDENYKAIEEFILEDYTYYTIAEVIQINHEQYPIGDDERKHAFAIKPQDSDEVMGFILATVMDKTTDSPSMFLQYIVISPKYQHQGIGKKALKELLENPEPYFDSKITEMFAYVHNQNFPSISLMLDIGSTLTNMQGTCYFRSLKKIPQVELDKE